MSVHFIVTLRCNGPRCGKDFSAVPPVGTAVAVRDAAMRAGWSVNRKHGEFCPDCAKNLKPRHAWARGICQCCKKERTVTAAGLIHLHRHEHQPCPGGGHGPARVVSHGKPSKAPKPYPGWKESA